MGEFKIESDVPITARGRGHDEFSKTLLSLEVGQSFDIAGSSVASSPRNNIINRALAIGKAHGRKFSWRRTRVWRVA